MNKQKSFQEEKHLERSCNFFATYEIYVLLFLCFTEQWDLSCPAPDVLSDISCSGTARCTADSDCTMAALSQCCPAGPQCGRVCAPGGSLSFKLNKTTFMM